jgi:hypothetical protein
VHETGAAALAAAALLVTPAFSANRKVDVCEISTFAFPH